MIAFQLCNPSMKTPAMRSIVAIFILAAGLVIPCHAAGKKVIMTMPNFTKGDKIPNSRQINF